jgi:hypothetical protein
MDAAKWKQRGAKREYSFSNKHFGANDDMHWHTNWYSATVSISEQLPEDGLVWPKYVVIKCDFNDILKQRRDCERLLLILFLLKIIFCFISSFKYYFSVPLGSTCSFCPALSVDVLVQLYLCFLASRLWMRREHERVGIPLLLHRRVCDFVVLQLWTIVDVLLTQPSCGT